MGGPYNTFLWNFAFATAIFWIGGPAYFVMRYMKGDWQKHTWSYIPVFWLPIMFSWPVSLTALFGGFD